MDVPRICHSAVCRTNIFRDATIFPNIWRHNASTSESTKSKIRSSVITVTTRELGLHCTDLKFLAHWPSCSVSPSVRRSSPECIVSWAVDHRLSGFRHIWNHQQHCFVPEGFSHNIEDVVRRFPSAICSVLISSAALPTCYAVPSCRTIRRDTLCHATFRIPPGLRPKAFRTNPPEKRYSTPPMPSACLIAYYSNFSPWQLPALGIAIRRYPRRFPLSRHATSLPEVSALHPHDGSKNTAHFAEGLA